MIDESIKEEILVRIQLAEEEHNVKVLYAIESGSRAWGFASANSDYDVRFIYAHPQDWYLAVDLEDQPDVIEYPIEDDIDINGWDIRKALKLFWKSNPTFVEWMQSPIVYLEAGDFAEQCRALLPRIYSPPKGIFHYLNIAKTNYQQHLNKDKVSLKKYFYALRPLLAARWIETHQAPPPIVFDKLLSVEKNRVVLDEIQSLLKQKKSAQETAMIAPIHLLNQFIVEELKSWATYQPKRTPREAAMEDLNELFRDTLGTLE